MKLYTLPLAALLVLVFASTGVALPPPCEEDAMVADSAMIVDGMVSDVTCVGKDSDNDKTVTTYISTLQVTNTYKGDEMDSVTITGTTVEWEDPAMAPVGGWDQPAYPVGTKGKFYLVADDANDGYKLVCWNGLIEADDSTENGNLPECGNEDPPVDPPVDPPANADPYTPNDCWAEKCSAEFDKCKADASCVAFSLCIEMGANGDACFEQYATDHPNAPADDNGNHPDYLALQQCGWSACNDPNAASCAEPGKNGAVNRCDQWDDSWPCNCDGACDKYGDCCADKEEVCGGDEPDPPACTPSCGNKDCGDDGCGGSCGTCQDGFSCSKAQLCVEDEPEECQNACAEGDKGCDESGTPWTCAMAGSGCYEKFAGTACAEGVTCTDGVCGGGDEPAPQPGDDGDNTKKNGDDGGCNTTAPTHTGGIVLLALVLLGLALRRESDETVA